MFPFSLLRFLFLLALIIFSFFCFLFSFLCLALSLPLSVPLLSTCAANVLATAAGALATVELAIGNKPAGLAPIEKPYSAARPRPSHGFQRAFSLRCRAPRMSVDRGCFGARVDILHDRLGAMCDPNADEADSLTRAEPVTPYKESHGSVP